MLGLRSPFRVATAVPGHGSIPRADGRTAEAIDVFPGALPQATATISSHHGHRMLTRRGTAEPPQPEGAAHAGTLWRPNPAAPRHVGDTAPSPGAGRGGLGQHSHREDGRTRRARGVRIAG